MKQLLGAVASELATLECKCDGGRGRITFVMSLCHAVLRGLAKVCSRKSVPLGGERGDERGDWRMIGVVLEAWRYIVASSLWHTTREYPTRAFRFPCPTKVSTRVSHKNLPRECPIRHKSVSEECSTRVSHKSAQNIFPKECPARAFHKSVKQYLATCFQVRVCIRALGFHRASMLACLSMHLCSDRTWS